MVFKTILTHLDSNEDVYYVNFCFFFKCSSNEGGAIYSSDGTLIVNSCIFANCTAETRGSAIRTVYGYSILHSCCVKHCESNEGGDIHFAGPSKGAELIYVQTSDNVNNNHPTMLGGKTIEITLSNSTYNKISSKSEEVFGSVLCFSNNTKIIAKYINGIKCSGQNSIFNLASISNSEILSISNANCIENLDNRYIISLQHHTQTDMHLSIENSYFLGTTTDPSLCYFNHNAQEPTVTFTNCFFSMESSETSENPNIISCQFKQTIPNIGVVKIQCFDFSLCTINQQNFKINKTFLFIYFFLTQIK